MNQLEKLVSLLLAPHQVPNDLTVDNEEDGYDENDYKIIARWNHHKNGLTLVACSHQILIRATLDDGGPCPPSRLYEYAHWRLDMLLKWMNAAETMEALDHLETGADFYAKYPNDPVITKPMFGGRVTVQILRQAEKIFDATELLRQASVV